MEKKRRRRINIFFLAIALIGILLSKLLFLLRTTPLGVMLVAGIAFMQSNALPTTLSTSMPIISQMVLIFGMTLTACFNRSRFFFILLILFLSQLAITSSFPGHLDKAFAAQGSYALINILLPLNILFFSSLSERGIFSKWGQKKFFLIVFQIALIFLLIFSSDKTFVKSLSTTLIVFSFMPKTPIPHLAIISFIFTSILLLMQRRRITSHFKTTIFSVLFAIICAHHFHWIPIALPLFYATAGLLIIVSVIQDYHFKAYLDELTTLPSRRSLNENLLKLDATYVIAMVDIDFFKDFNDTYGHDAGDDVLRLVARLIGECRGGKSFRYGGEEFTILFPGKHLEEVVPYLEELRENIANANFALRREQGAIERVNVTVSIGVAEATRKSTHPQEVIKAADMALYRAKDHGRNCVSV